LAGTGLGGACVGNSDAAFASGGNAGKAIGTTANVSRALRVLLANGVGSTSVLASVLTLATKTNQVALTFFVPGAAFAADTAQASLAAEALSSCYAWSLTLTGGTFRLGAAGGLCILVRV
jgi:hypothetical protein